MPAFEFNKVQDAFCKQCSCCEEIFVGTKDREESAKIFEDNFAFSNGSALTADGFQSRCRFCNSSKRRELGVTRSSLQAMFNSQQGHCAICAKDISITFRADSSIHAHVDHDDATMRIRGLLCGDCNRGIGLLKHNPIILQAAINYLLESLRKEAA